MKIGSDYLAEELVDFLVRPTIAEKKEEGVVINIKDTTYECNSIHLHFPFVCVMFQSTYVSG